MDKERVTEQATDELPEKNGFIIWVKDNKAKLLLAGISITTLIVTILSLKNKDAIIELWNSLKKELEKGALYSGKWFEKASLQELQDARRSVELDHRNPELDLDYRSECWELLKRFDKAIGEKQWQGKEYGYPVHGKNGLHLLSDD